MLQMIILGIAKALAKSKEQDSAGLSALQRPNSVDSNMSNQASIPERAASNSLARTRQAENTGQTCGDQGRPPNSSATKPTIVKYNDPHLDATGVELLDGIISLHKQEPERAMQSLDRLILAYPKSAQLWVSKGIFTESKDILDKQRCFERAAEINDRFYDASRRWARCIRIGTCSFYGGTSGDRVKFMAGILAFSLKPEDEQLAFAASHDELFQPNWKERYIVSLQIMEVGLLVADRDQYPENTFAMFSRELNMLSSLDDDEKKLAILTEWANYNR